MIILCIDQMCRAKLELQLFKPSRLKYVFAITTLQHMHARLILQDVIHTNQTHPLSGPNVTPQFLLHAYVKNLIRIF